ncbi:hypothetical protein TNCV_423761 [Trichonephila clavipes]|nr:hypothetical protein TNCV_423761 [Trichonephila clavipes]
MKLRLSPYIMTRLFENSEPIQSFIAQDRKESVRSVGRGFRPKTACVAIPRGNRKTYKANFIHNCGALLPLLHQTKALKSEFRSSPSPDVALNLISKIKQLYAVIRRERVGIACVKVLTHILLTLISGNCVCVCGTGHSENVASG